MDTWLGGLGARMAIARNGLGLSQSRMAEACRMSVGRST
jgi:transcriptional regulator with XRE-family HTH domain